MNLRETLAELVVAVLDVDVKGLRELLVEWKRTREHQILWVDQVGVSDLVSLSLRIQVSLRTLIRLVHDDDSAEDEGTEKRFGLFALIDVLMKLDL